MTRSIRRPIWLEPQVINGLLTCYGMHFVKTLAARKPDEAAESASMIGFFVAVKLDLSAIAHKSDVGGVLLDLNSADEVKQAFNAIRARLEKDGRQDDMRGVGTENAEGRY